jgi:hypothetical protein
MSEIKRLFRVDMIGMVVATRCHKLQYIAITKASVEFGTIQRVYLVDSGFFCPML